ASRVEIYNAIDAWITGMLLISEGVCEYRIVRTESRNVKMVIKRKISFKMLKEKIEDENSRYWEAEATYLELLKDMEHQKIELDNVVAAYLKEKIAFDCKKQLLSRLKDKVDEMNESLAYERANFMDKKHKIHSTVIELQVNYKKIIGSKLILEGELEALGILT
ncbi:hypothetical protein Tco_0218490, partial [Tanacetum coccineum]